MIHWTLTIFCITAIIIIAGITSYFCYVFPYLKEEDVRIKKTRVVKIDDLYYPQFRIHFIWINFTLYECFKNIELENSTSFHTLEDAIEFCKRKIKDSKPKPSETVWTS